MKLDHVGIAVRDLSQALEQWKLLGAVYKGTEEVVSQKVRVAFLQTGESKTELLEPTDPSSPIAKFLDSGKKGVHHLAYQVADIDSKLAELKSQGLSLIHEQAVPGAGGTRVAFIHPKSVDGVLVELVEYSTGNVRDTKED